MNKLRWLLIALLLIGTLALLVQSETNRAISSVVSRGEDGWYGFRQALELRDMPLEVARKPWGEALDEAKIGAAENAVWIIAFPWQRSLDRDEMREMSDFLRRGGTVWLAYSGSAGSADEISVLESLGLGRLKGLRKPVPMSPLAWWRHRNERWKLEPDPDSAPGGVGVEIPALDVAPAPPPNAAVYFSASSRTDGRPGSDEHGAMDGIAGQSSPLIFGYERFGGRVLVVPAVLWSNAEILNGGNLELLHHLAQTHGSETRWWVDEYHHGLLHPDLVQQSAANASWDLFFLHLALIYCLGVWALARRFGPAWQERPTRFGSTAEFLENLGGLHHRLGHHRAAARHMAVRMADLYPRVEPSAGSRPESGDAESAAEQVSDGPSLIHFARKISAQKISVHKLSTQKHGAREPSRD